MSIPLCIGEQTATESSIVVDVIAIGIYVEGIIEVVVMISLITPLKNM